MDQTAPMPIDIKCQGCKGKHIKLNGLGYGDGNVWDVFKCLDCGCLFDGAWMESISDVLFFKLTDEQRADLSKVKAV